MNDQLIISYDYKLNFELWIFFV